jgi:Na+/melibiose symporter-like transporter
VLNDAGYILGAGADTRTELGAFLEILTAMANIATAIVLFPILRRVNQAVALGYVAIHIVESTIIVIGLISLMAVVALRRTSRELAASTGAGGGPAVAGRVPPK